MTEKRTSVFENGLIWFGAAVSIAEILTGTYFAPLGFAKGLLAIVIGTGAGAVASHPVGNYLLQEQIASAESESAETIENFGGKFQGNGKNKFQNFGNMGGVSLPGTADHVEYLDSLNATTDLNVLLSLMGISILLTLAAGSVGMISVLRYEPLKILSER